jgi:hypothetical protein
MNSYLRIAHGLVTRQEFYRLLTDREYTAAS